MTRSSRARRSDDIPTLSASAVGTPSISGRSAGAPISPADATAQITPTPIPHFVTPVLVISRLLSPDYS